MIYYAAIDWKASFIGGFSYMKLDAETLEQAQITAPAAVYRYAKEEHENGMANVYAIVIIGKTRETAPTGEGLVVFDPVTYQWEESFSGTWYF